MNILAIDTSTKAEMIAASRDGRVSDKTSITGISHSVALFDNIDQALKGVDLTAKDLDLIGVGIGPGSFTGIRIGVSTARMMAQLLRIPLVGFYSPLLFACSIEAPAGTDIIIAFDAKKGRVFGGRYRIAGQHSIPDEIIPPGDYAMEYLLAGSGSPVILAGDGAEKYNEITAKQLPEYRLLADFIPSGAAGCRLTGLLYTAGPERYGDIKATVPYYARKSDAEIALDGRRDTQGN